MTQRTATTSLPTPVRTPDSLERSRHSIARAREAMKEWSNFLAGEQRVRLLERLLWAFATLTVMIVVWYLQDRNHPPLVWDEAVRMQNAALFAHAFRHGSLAEAWKVMNQGGHYPFLAPLIHSLVLVVTGNIIVAAWLPSLIAYTVSGIFAGRLAVALGSGRTGAWIAAILCWFTPINARVAGGSFTEMIGACVLLLLLLALIRLQQRGDMRSALRVGLIGIVAWFLKYDYGLLATVTAVLIGGMSLIARRNRRALKTWVTVVICFIFPFAAWLAVNFAAKWSSFSYLFVSPYWRRLRSNGLDWSYYPRALITGDDVGLAPLVAAFFVASLAWAVFAVTRDRTGRVSGAAVLLVLWYGLYSIHPGTERYLALVLPVIAALGSAFLVRLLRFAFVNTRRVDRRYLPWIQVSFLGVMLGLSCWQLGQQIAGSTGITKRFDFLEPYQPADSAYAFALNAIHTTTRPVLVLGEVNELSAGTLRVPLYQRYGFHAPILGTVADVAPIENNQRDAVLSAAKRISAGRIIAFDIEPGSKFDTPDVQTYHSSQRAYIQFMQQLEEHHALNLVAMLSTDEGRLRVYSWDIVSLPEVITVSVELVNGVNAYEDITKPITIPLGSNIVISGWAIDGFSAHTAGGVALLVDGTEIWPVQYGERREDIAKRLGRLSYLESGWHIAIPAGVIPHGVHKITVRTLSKDGRSWYTPPQLVSPQFFILVL